MLIEITIPVLNEEDTLKQNIEKIISFIEDEESRFCDAQICLVIADNGSTDATDELGRQLANDHKNVRYISVPDRGVGLALKSSWGESKADIIGYMDLDLATDLKHLPQAIAAIKEEGYDVVTGSRLLPDSEVINRKIIRSIVSRIFNMMLQAYFAIKFSDGMCGFKFLRREIYPELYNAGAQNNGWFFATEILITADYLGFKLKDIPVRWVDDPNSKAKIIKLSIEYLKSMRELKKSLSKIK